MGKGMGTRIFYISFWVTDQKEVSYRWIPVSWWTALSWEQVNNILKREILPIYLLHYWKPCVGLGCSPKNIWEKLNLTLLRGVRMSIDNWANNTFSASFHGMILISGLVFVCGISIWWKTAVSSTNFVNENIIIFLILLISHTMNFTIHINNAT